MLKSELQKHFGHQDFRPGQQLVVEQLLAGQNTLALLPTGGGKSICYQLPSVLEKGLTVVISPLLALMKDQVDKAQINDQRVSRYDSSIGIQGKEECLSALRKNQIDLLYISPESFAANDIYNLLKGLKISLIAIDEAHCYSEWGHSFRPAYLHLPRLVKGLKAKAVLALTATATKKVASEIRKAFQIKLCHQVSTSFYRPNLNYSIEACSNSERLDKLSHLLKSGPDGSCIVYAMRQVDTMQIAAHLQSQGIQARSYHAGMDTEARENVQSLFLQNRVRVIVATIAFGMGIDKPDIRQVIHFHLPKSPEGWMQESGRAGRDGQPSLCTLLACGDDVRQLRSFIRSRSVDPSTIRSILNSLQASDKVWLCAPFMLGVQYDLSAAMIGIILLQLEQLKIIKHKLTSWRYLRVRKLRFGTKVTGLTKRQTQVTEELCKLDNRCDTFEAQKQFSMSRTQLLKLATELESSGEFSVKRSGWTEEYQVSSKEIHTEDLILSLSQKLNVTLKQDFSRIDEMLSLVNTRACITKKLLAIFGERLEKPCQNCSSCRKEPRLRILPQSSVPELQNEQLEMIQTVHRESHSALKSPRTLTRFLCDIPSPKIRYYRLYRHELHGVLSEFDHEEVELQARINLGAP